MSSGTTDDYVWLTGIGIAVILVFGYSVLILQQPLVGGTVVIPLLLLYLLWRLVRGVERIATALEAGDDGAATGDEDSSVDGAGGAGETTADWSHGGETGADQ